VQPAATPNRGEIPEFFFLLVNVPTFTIRSVATPYGSAKERGLIATQSVRRGARKNESATMNLTLLPTTDE
jgi:hypothetical protein